MKFLVAAHDWTCCGEHISLENNLYLPAYISHGSGFWFTWVLGFISIWAVKGVGHFGPVRYTFHTVFYVPLHVLYSKILIQTIKEYMFSKYDAFKVCFYNSMKVYDNFSKLSGRCML